MWLNDEQVTDLKLDQYQESLLSACPNHIVIDGFMISKESLKDFCLTINYSNDDFKKLLGKMDSKVYTYNRAFSFLHQNKMGGKEFFEWIYCWEDDDKKYSQTDITYKYLINHFNSKTYE